MENFSNSSGMSPSSATDLIAKRSGLSFVVAIVFWTMAIAALAGWHYYQTYRAAVANATTAARHSSSKDLTYRNWSLLHNGIYVPVTAETPPNPYLAHLPERDLHTSSGQLLTLINPSYMTRVVHDMGDPVSGTLGHITSLLPIRAENAPDEWEASALQNFEKGVTEQSSLEPIGSETYLRLMRPMMVEAVCLKCHGSQGYQVGDVLGGISVSIPWEPYRQALLASLPGFGLGYGGLWLLGMAGIMVSNYRLRRHLERLSQVEHTLRQSEARYHGMFANNHAVMLLIDPADGRILDANPAACAFYGYGQDDLRAMKITDINILSPAQVMEEMTRAKALARNHLHFRHRLANGEVRDVEVFSGPVEISGRNLLYSIVHDVSERRRAQEGLRLAKFCIDHASIGIFRINEDGRIAEANDQACRSLGYSREELLALSILDIDPRFSRESWLQRREVIKEKGSGFIETLCRRKDGSVFTAEVTINYFELGGRSFSYSFFQDISARKKAEEKLNFKARLLNMVGQAVMATDQNGLITYWNLAAEEIYGWPAAEALGQNVLDITPTSVSRAQAEEIMRTLALGQSWTGDFEVQRRDGTTFLAHVTDTPIQDEAGLLVGIIGISFDITEHRRAEQELRKLSFAVQQSPVSVMIAGLEGEVEYVNPKFSQTTGYTLNEVRGRNLRVLQSGRSAEEYDDLWETLVAGEEWHGELHSKKKDGTPFWEQASISPVRDAAGIVTHYVAINEDITERKQNEAQLEFQATHDALTGLANRSLLQDRLEQSICYADRSGRLVAVLLLDLDRFKIVNDSLGHDFGDQLLCAVAQRLQQNTRNADTVARLGGDEFVVLLAEVAETEDVGLVARKILDSLALPYRIGDREITVTASLGISLYPIDSRDSTTLIRDADMAMYRAKRDDISNFVFHSPEMNQRIFATLELEGALRKALEREEFCLHYQPKVNMASGLVIGCEALVRWRHPQRGMVSPADFIPLAEETGLIVPLGTWVLEEACRQAKAWQDQGMPELCVAVNLSARQFRKGDLPEIVRGVLHNVGLDPRLLDLELTESIVMNNPAEAAQTMQNLKNLGVRLSLDDFGTGYSSLNYLRHFPVDSLKIDRTFVCDVTTDPSGASVVNSVIDIAHNLGLTTVAEGVETREQLAFLTGCGCDMFQGYLFSKPLPAEEFTDLLRERWRLKIA